MYFALTGLWCAVYGFCFGIQMYLQLTRLIGKCLFIQDGSSGISSLLAAGVICIVCTVGNVCLHAMIVKHILRARSIQVGRRHGNTVYLWF